MYLIIFIALISVLLYKFVIKPSFYWKERNVIYQKPWPLLGNMAPTFFKRKSMYQQAIDFYKEFPNERYNGIFQFTKPVLLIRDLDLMKDIMIKDFDHFTDHNSIFSENDPLMGKQLFSMKGQTWRNMRATLSPTFTSSKMRYMFVLILECAEKFSSHIEKKASPIFSAEMQDFYTRFTNDAIASVIFGYTCDSVAEPDNQFYVMCKKATNFSGWMFLKFILFNMCPFFVKLFNLTFFSKEVYNFFTGVVKDNIEKREKEGIVRPDLIQILMDARSGRSKYNESLPENSQNEGFATVQESNFDNAKVVRNAFVTPEDITAQAFIFFFSGFDAASFLMCFLSYELAVNVEVQEKLHDEIDETLKKCNGKITYELLLGMKYLDMVVSETLRKWALGFQSDRVCVKDYEIEPVKPEEKSFLVEKGTLIIFPICGIHSDPKLYPNPEKFDPERFNEQNKKSIPQFAYIPFGAGPRNCIASRFVLLEAKTLIFTLLSKFTITVVEKTPIPLVLTKKTFRMQPDEGFWLGFKQRKV